MYRTIKLFLILAIICLGLGIGLTALTQETSVNEEVKLDEEVKAEDLDIKEPKILPDSSLYFLKEWGRGIQSFFAFGQLKKTELEQKFANERLMELKTLVEKGGDPEILKKATEKYEKALEKIQARAEKIEEKAKENPEVEKFLDKFTKQQLLHQRILQKLEEQVPTEVLEKIKEARERHLEKFGEVMTKLEDRMDEVREKLEKNLEEIKGSKYKNFKNLEVLIELEEKVPEQAKEAIRKAQENALKRLKENLEKMSPEDQERFKEYIERISGDKEKQLEILENLKFEIKQKETDLKQKINEVRQNIVNRIKEEAGQIKYCPEATVLSPDFCKEGRITTEKDEKGCLLIKCAIPAEFEIPQTPTLPEKPAACITLWNPVCGKDGKTYSNSCFAKLAGVEVDYEDECKEKVCQTDADCPQPKCGPLGTIMAKCVGVKAKCIEGKCVIE